MGWKAERSSGLNYQAKQLYLLGQSHAVHGFNGQAEIFKLSKKISEDFINFLDLNEMVFKSERIEEHFWDYIIKFTLSLKKIHFYINSFWEKFFCLNEIMKYFQHNKEVNYSSPSLEAKRFPLATQLFNKTFYQVSRNKRKKKHRNSTMRSNKFYNDEILLCKVLLSVSFSLFPLSLSLSRSPSVAVATSI